MVIACRDETRGEAAAAAASPKKGEATTTPAAVDGEEADTILSPKKKTALKAVVSMQCDLSDLESIRNFAAAFLFAYKRLDGLINNAAVMGTRQHYTKDGFELQFGTNHLGHFLLTDLLLDVLKKSAPARVVVLSSVSHTKTSFNPMGHIDFEDVMYDKGREYDPMGAYAQVREDGGARAGGGGEGRHPAASPTGTSPFL